LDSAGHFADCSRPNLWLVAKDLSTLTHAYCVPGPVQVAHQWPLLLQ
jgi:hypothetical protein